MDFQKLDPVLAAELSDGTEADPTRELPVFIHIAEGPDAEGLDVDDRDLLARRYGLPQPVIAGGVMSATVTAEQVAELSEEPWVVMIRAARQLRTMR